MRVEELELRDLVLYFDGLDVGVIVNESPSVEVVDLHLTSFESYQQELDVNVRSDQLCLLLLDLLEIGLVFPLIGLSQLIFAGFNEVAPHALVRGAVPNSHEQVGINCVELEGDFVHDEAYQL